METKCLGLFVSALVLGCSGTSLELGVLDGAGGGGAAAKPGKTDVPGKPNQGKGGSSSSSGGASSTPSVASAEGGDSGESVATGGSSPAAGGAPLNLVPEDDGADCAVSQLPAASELTEVIEKLPDPFTRLDGTVITHKSDWRCRRAELKKQAEVYAFGGKPPAPETVNGTVSPSGITVEVANGPYTASFDVSVQLPTTGSAPYPAMIEFNGGWEVDANALRDEGVATISFKPTDLGAENPSLPHQGAFYDVNPDKGSTGLLVAWAWGVSRIIDVIEKSGSSLIDPRAIGITGCSRYGKGAFVAGAFDQRLALTVPAESGSAGVPVWRGIAKDELGENGEASQSLSSVYSEQPWFGAAFEPFLAPGAIERSPIDTHELVAMVAPRGLLIFDNPAIGQLSPKYSHLAALAGAEVYGALGALGNVGYQSDRASGNHCAIPAAWKAPFLAAVKKFLSKTGSDPLQIQPRADFAADLGEWRDWSTPTLD